MRFQCPSCKRQTQIESVEVNALVITPIRGIVQTGKIVYSDAYSVGGELDRYRCADCSCEFLQENGELVSNESELIDWLNSKTKRWQTLVEEETPVLEAT